MAAELSSAERANEGVVELSSFRFPTSISLPAPPHQTGLQSACAACIRRKKGCTRTQPGGKCDKCLKNGEDCYLPEPRVGGGPLRRTGTPSFQTAQQASLTEENSNRRQRRESENYNIQQRLQSGAAPGAPVVMRSGLVSPTSPTTVSGMAPPVRQLARPPVNAAFPSYLALVASSPSSSSTGSNNPLPSPDDLPLLALAMEGYWACFHVGVPIIHRWTFEEAFLVEEHPVFGRPPTALLYAMAANGVRRSHLPPSQDAISLGHHFSAKAKDLLVEQFYNSQTMTSFEAVHVMTLLYIYLTAEKVAPMAFPMLERLTDELLKLCRDPDGSGRFIGFVEPADHREWIRTDMLLRLFLHLANLDSSYTYLQNRDPLFDYFARPIALPCHESFFSSISREAFARLKQRGLASWATVDLSGVSLDPTNLPSSIQGIADIVSPVFDQRASSMAIMHVLSLFRDLSRKTKNFAKEQGIAPLELACKPKLAEVETPAEQSYRTIVSVFHSLIECVTTAMPQEVGEALNTGNPAPLLRKGGQYTSDPRYAHALISSYISMRALELDSWLPAKLDTTSPALLAFFDSAPFLTTLEAAIVATRLMESQLQADPQLRYQRTFGFISALRIGGLHVAIVKMAAEGKSQMHEAIQGAKQDAKIAATWLNTMGYIYRPLGMELAESFRKLLVEASIVQENPAAILAMSLAEIGQMSSAPSKNVLLDLNDWVRPFIR